MSGIQLFSRNILAHCLATLQKQDNENKFLKLTKNIVIEKNKERAAGRREETMMWIIRDTMKIEEEMAVERQGAKSVKV